MNEASLIPGYYIGTTHRDHEDKWPARGFFLLYRVCHVTADDGGGGVTAVWPPLTHSG